MFKTKKYKTLENNYKVISESLRELRKRYTEFQEKAIKQNTELRESLKESEDIRRNLANSLEYYGLQRQDLANEVKRLKRILTMNGISYEKKGGKNGK